VIWWSTGSENPYTHVWDPLPSFFHRLEPARDRGQPKAMSEILKPQSTERIELLSGRKVTLSKATLLFRKWAGETPPDTFNGKPLIELNGEMVFAELAILRSFQQAGWDGRWIDSFHHRYLTNYWPVPVSEPLPAKQQLVFDRIRSKAGGTGGCFDVFCWRGGELLFAESKWHDRILKTQTQWLEAALDVGIPIESFLIVQWGFESP
jgi:hypothetical protein